MGSTRHRRPRSERDPQRGRVGGSGTGGRVRGVRLFRHAHRVCRPARELPGRA
ncbi:hypothetical protein FM103_05490 [Corynebacterium xerosis]|nr:hypothetical protein FM103_05490 [Corynebacterium xerosis]